MKKRRKRNLLSRVKNAIRKGELYKAGLIAESAKDPKRQKKLIRLVLKAGG